MEDALKTLLEVVVQYCRVCTPGEYPVEVSIRLHSGHQVLHPVPMDRQQRRTHSPCFRSVCWCGVVYSLTGTQAAIVRILWESWEHGAPEVSADHLLESVDSQTGRLRDLFARNPAWGNLIVPGTSKGTWKLNV